MTYEFAVEFGFNFKYFEVQAETGKAAREKLWNEVLTDDEKNGVSSIELVSEAA